MSRDKKISFPKGWPIVVAILIGLFAALPLLRGIPDGADTLLHFYRTVQLNRLLDEGILLSPWAPDLAHGFGYPIFNYYAPLSYYLASSMTQLGMDVVVAFQAIFVLSFIFSSVFMFLWVRDLFADTAALIAAAIYAMSPYLMVDAVSRGALAELLALSILPGILWSARRFIASGSWVYGLAGLLGYAAVILTHNITALVFTPILAGYIVVISYAKHRSAGTAPHDSKARTAAALWFLLLGLALSAFFWIPALLERSLVQIEQVIGPSDFNFENNFVSLSRLIALPFSTDLNLINRDVPIALSLVAVILGVVGLVSLRRYPDQPEKMGLVIYAGLVFLGSLFLTLSISSIIWEVIPLLQFLQFPWRFLGIATLFLAFLSGAGAETLMGLEFRKINLRTVIPVVLIAAAALYILPWQFTTYYIPTPDGSLAGLNDFEQQSGYLGTTSTGEYLPIRVQELPSQSDFDPIAEGLGLRKGSLPSGARMEVLESSPLSFTLLIDTPETFQIIFDTFFFEGWQALIDGKSVPISPTEPGGLIGIEVPEGRHELWVRFSSTPTRLSGRIISLVAVLIIVVTIVLLRRSDTNGDQVELSQGRHSTRNALILMTVVIVGIAAFKVLYLDRTDNPLARTRFDGLSVGGVDISVRVNFDDEMILMGVDVPDEVYSGESMDVTLYWRVGRDVERDYSVSAVVVDSDGVVLTQSDRQHPGIQPTSRWSTSDYAAGEHQITLPPGTPPGEYHLQVNVYEYGLPDNRLNLLDSSGMPAGQTADVVTISVLRPDRPAEMEDIEHIRIADLPLGDAISLTGYSLPEYDVRSGDAIFPVFYWRAVEDPAEDLLISINLLDEKGQLTEIKTTHLLRDYPATSWQKDDLWMAVHPLIIPPSLDSGVYSLVLGLADGEQLSLGTIEVESPEHIFVRPETDFQPEVNFRDVAELAGYQVDESVFVGDMLHTMLVWQAIGETQSSYKTFVQLLDQEGRLVSGSDMIPGNWQRPTTGWVEGEYIVDEHVLTIPEDLEPGEYQLLVGIYGLNDLQRLRTESGQDSWFIPHPIEVIPR